MTTTETTTGVSRKRLGASTFNVIAGLIVLAGLIIVVIRFTRGLGAVGNYSQEDPWGVWIGFNVLCGVAMAAGGYVLASTVYLFGLKQYRPLLRPAILTGFLGYFFVVVALLCDLGRPWRLPYPMFYSFGVASVLFLVAWHVALYLTVQFLEFCPAIFEWLGWKNVRRGVAKLTIGATIAGLILSLLHQSALGGLFLLAPTKVHPLWYSPLLPLFFFVTSVVGGLSMVIFESWLSRRIFQDQIEPGQGDNIERLILGLGRAASVALFCYFFLKWIGVARGQHWDLLGTSMGKWFLVEMFVFVLLPCLLFAAGVRAKNVSLIRYTSILAIIGIIINRLNVSMVALGWDREVRAFPHWMEIVVAIAIITTGVLVFRWIVKRMPVLHEHPDYKGVH